MSKGYYTVVAEIIVDSEVKDIDYGNTDPNKGVPDFQRSHKDEAKAYYSDTNIGPDIFLILLIPHRIVLHQAT